MTLASVPSYDPDAVPENGSHAVVVGGSIAGLLAARVLADGYEQVTILERDPVPAATAPRRGVPQGHHVHVMLEAGRKILNELFPGYQETLSEAGGEVFDGTPNLAYFDRGEYLATATKPLWMCCATRPLFEQVTRKHVTDLDRVTLRSDCHCTEYLTDDGVTAVTGVEFKNEKGSAESLTADLVVDTTGRTSKTHTWLEAHGYQSPPVDTVEIDLAYSTVTIDRPPVDTSVYLVAPSVDNPRGAAVAPVEADKWIVTLFGIHGTHPPTDSEGFLEFAKQLPVPEVAELLGKRSWISEGIEHYPFPANQWRHYEELMEFPDGLLVTGDALASFNPIYGQGMSVAALDALQLHHALAGGETDLACRFFDRAADHIDTVWRIAVGSDFEFPETTGTKPVGTDLFNRYTSRLIATAHENQRVATEFYHVLRLEKEPTALLKPNIIGRVLLPSILNP